MNQVEIGIKEFFLEGSLVSFHHSINLGASGIGKIVKDIVLL